ncbi:MAG: bifunctional adenosylcobinamide kinase/adenosylcobinamide-phosphate guanylyltransferase [Bacillota bacterium]
MVNAVLTAELFIPGAASLKEKRGRLKRLLERLRLRFNVAVAEVGGQNTWQRATLAVAAVAGEVACIHRVLQEVVDYIDGYGDTMLADYRVDLYGFYLGSGDEANAAKVNGGGCTLITGGVFSGRILFAASLLHRSSPVVYLSMSSGGGAAYETDLDVRARFPAHWETVQEPGDPARAILDVPPEAALVIGCLGGWVAGLLDKDETENDIYALVNGIINALRAREGTVLAVSAEVGMGTMPVDPREKIYRRVLGKINQQLAGMADSVYLVVCGIPHRVKP